MKSQVPKRPTARLKVGRKTKEGLRTEAELGGTGLWIFTAWEVKADRLTDPVEAIVIL